MLASVSKRKRDAKNQNAPKSDQRVNRAMHTALHASTESGMHAWVVDSGASAHMASDPSLSFEYRELSDTVKYADGSVGMVDGVGSVSVIFNGFAITLHEVLCVPSLSGNLFSVTAAAAHGTEVKFSKLGCEFVCSGQERFLVPRDTSSGLVVLVDTLKREPTVHYAFVAESASSEHKKAEDLSESWHKSQVWPPGLCKFVSSAEREPSRWIRICPFPEAGWYL